MSTILSALATYAACILLVGFLIDFLHDLRKR